MARGGFSVKGTDKLAGKLRRNANLDDVRNVVRLNGSELQREMQRKAQFKGHWRGNKFIPPTGATKRSIKYTSRDNGFTAKVGPQTEYSPYLEYGTRFMSAQPFVRPAFNKQKKKFIRDMKRIMK